MRFFQIPCHRVYVDTGQAKLFAKSAGGRPDRACEGWRLVANMRSQLESSIAKAFENLMKRRMPRWILLVIIFKILLTDVGGFAVFREQMVEWLVATRPAFLGNGVPPFLTVGKFRIDIENDTAKGQEAVTHYFTDAKACGYELCTRLDGISDDFDPVVFHFPVQLPWEREMLLAAYG